MRFPDDVPVLTDGRVTLRAHRLEDLDGVFQVCSDPDSQAFTTIPVPYSRDDAAAFITGRGAGWEKGTSLAFAIESADGVGTSRFAGSIGIDVGAPGLGEIGFMVHPRARGRGITTAAIRLIADWAFEKQHLETLVWRSVAGNLASWRVAWLSGFGFETATRGTLPQRGRLLDGWTATLRATDSREPKTRWLAVPRLTDERVALRPMRLDDETRYLETVHDPETDRWLSDIQFPRDPTAFQAHVRDAGLFAALGQLVLWAIADAGTDQYVGGFGMFGFGGLDHASAEVGYRSHPDSRGRGYVSGAMRLAIAHAFTAADDGGYGLERLSLGAGDGNVPSLALARACGFTETGRDRRCYRLSDDTVVDLIRFDLLREEWR